MQVYIIHAQHIYSGIFRTKLIMKICTIKQKGQGVVLILIFIINQSKHLFVIA